MCLLKLMVGRHQRMENAAHTFVSRGNAIIHIKADVGEFQLRI